MAAIGQKGLPVIVWNIRLYAGITLRWLYLCKRKGSEMMKRALITIATVGILAPTAWVAGANAQYGAPAPAYGPAPAYAPAPTYAPAPAYGPSRRYARRAY